MFHCAFSFVQAQGPISPPLARFLLFHPFAIWGDERVEDFTNETAHWIEESVNTLPEVELELGVLIAAASEWTEDEMELDDLVAGLVESGSVQLQIG